METNRKKDNVESYFGTLPNVHIHAKYIDGKFFDIDTKEVLELNEGAFVKMVVLQKDILGNNYERFVTPITTELLPPNTLLSIHMPYKNEAVFELIVRIKVPLILEKKANKEAKVLDCKCEIVSYSKNGDSMNNSIFENLEFESLNQAFFQASVRLRPDNKSHHTNIYKASHLEDGRTLQSFRF